MPKFILYKGWDGTTYYAFVKKTFKNGSIRAEPWFRWEDGKTVGPHLGGWTLHLFKDQYQEVQ
jgi:hypothetical protein